MTPPDRPPFERRRAGALLHPTSLPGPFDGGVLGADARRFVDFLRAAGFSVWQMLPLGPVDSTLSPYLAASVHAGNPRLIDPSLPGGPTWRPEPDEPAGRDWPARRRLLHRLFERFEAAAAPSERRALACFWRAERRWLGPFALFEALKESQAGRPWWEWPKPLRRPDRSAVYAARREHRQAIRRIVFEQHLFHRQWASLKRYANRNGVFLFGDMPIYVSMDSSDVWWRRELFAVDEEGRAEIVAGVPPDYFSEDGQLWGNPLYRWDRMRAEGFQWWIDRVRLHLRQFDLVRIDHFRAIEAYWEIPGGAPTAREGRWVQGPGEALLEALDRAVGLGALVAEDLGMITPAVRQLRDRFRIPGMLVLQFAFDGSADNPFLPENHVERAVVYTGTHDNDTTAGWYRSLPPERRDYVNWKLSTGGHRAPEAAIDAALASPARLAVLPMQDLLGLGSESRMNTPGTVAGNWTWRFDWKDVRPGLAREYRERLDAADRLVL